MTSEPEVMIRRLTPDDLDAYIPLRRASLLDSPLAFLASPEDDSGSDPEIMRERLESAGGSVVLGAFGPGLLGAVGLYRQTRPKIAHKAGVWGMYVVPGRRGEGIGRRLITAAIEAARGFPGALQLHLSVSETATEALKLYQSCGFRVWGSEPRSLCHEGRCVTEHHLVLDLLPAAPGTKQAECSD